MRFHESLGVLTLASLLAACGSPSTNEAPEADLPFKVNESAISPKAKIFLVAGGQETASFAQEVIDQRQLWLGRGYTSDEIACYYAVPTTINYKADQKQYNHLIKELENCYAADLDIIEKHFLEVAHARENSDAKYFYFSSHGAQPLGTEIKDPRINATARQNLSELLRLKPWSNQFFLDVQMNLETWSIEPITARFRSPDDRFGATPKGTYALSPATLRPLLADFLGHKVVALQSCYSGGFLGSPEKSAAEDRLSSLNNVTVLTASAYDRPSFGCDPGAERTVYGDALLQELRRSSGRVDSLDWRGLSQKVSREVEARERALRVKPSNPQFFSNAI